MKKLIVAVVFVLVLLVGCGSTVSAEEHDTLARELADMQDDLNDLEEEIENLHSKLNLLAESETVIADSGGNTEVNPDYSPNYGIDESALSSEALIIESAEFENKEDDEWYSTVYIKVRNNSGQTGIDLGLTVDFIDENGDIVGSTYPDYESILEDGQACTLDVLFEGIPYGVRVATADITSISDERFDVIFETPFVAINPAN